MLMMVRFVRQRHLTRNEMIRVGCRLFFSQSYFIILDGLIERKRTVLFQMQIFEVDMEKISSTNNFD